MTEDYLDDKSPAADEAVEAVLAIGGLELFPADTRAEVERILLAGQSLEPQARARVVDAARRGARANSAGTRPVERLLYDARRAAERGIDDVALEVGLDAQVLADVERGTRQIRSVDARVTARWVKVLSIDPRTAVSAVTASFATASGAAQPYGSRRRVELDPKDAQYVGDVRAALGLSEPDRS